MFIKILKGGGVFIWIVFFRFEILVVFVKFKSFGCFGCRKKLLDLSVNGNKILFNVIVFIDCGKENG